MCALFFFPVQAAWSAAKDPTVQVIEPYRGVIEAKERLNRGLTEP